MIRVAIVGASGYTGQECVRLLASHPNVVIKHVFANTLANTSNVKLFSSWNRNDNFCCSYNNFSKGN